MPVVLRVVGLKFFFYSNEGNPLEPVHVHVRQAGCEAKIWLQPEIQIARNEGFDAKALKKILELVQQYQDVLKGAWYEYFA